MLTLTKSEQDYIQGAYENRLYTIRQIARQLDKSYEAVRLYLVSLGYQYGTK